MMKLLGLLMGEMWRPRPRGTFPCTVGGVTYDSYSDGSNHAPAWVGFRNGVPVEAARAPYGQQITRIEGLHLMKAGRYRDQDRDVVVDVMLPAIAVPADGALPCRAPVGQFHKRTCADLPTMIVDARGYLAECRGCGCATGYGSTKAEALALWNHWVSNPLERD